jgi:subtilisin-like proprotein convertase family protein
MRISTILLLASAAAASAATITVPFTGATYTIPDGNSSGIARTVTVNAPDERVVSAEVDVNISLANDDTPFLGDLYLYLSNGSHLSVLLNRPGRRAGAPAGYDDDDNINVTFSTAGTGDIHNYRVVLNGDHNTALTSGLTGIWQPDGRAVDPAAVLDTDARTAGLDIFAGDMASGDWHLYAADLSTGNVHRVNSWTLRLTTETIPEPGTSALAFGALAMLARRRRRN